MNIAQLEADLAAAKEKIRALADKTFRAAAEHVVTPATATEPAVTGRVLTDKEHEAIKALQADARTIEDQLSRAGRDATIMAEITRLTGGPSRPSALPAISGGRRISIGQQFVHDPGYRAFIAAAGHRRHGAWTSPAVEATHWYDLHAATLTEAPASGGALIQPDWRPGLVGLPMRRSVVADMIAPGTTDSNLIQYTKEKTFTNAAAPVKEGDPKPESTLIFEPATAPVRKVAHWMPVSEEMLEDYAQTASIIDARLRWGVEIKEEDQLLNGTGVDPQILGFHNLTGLAPEVEIGSDTIADAMLKQITAIAVNALITPDGWVMNPADWMLVQIAKNTQGNYLGTGPWAAPQTPMLWGIAGTVTPAEAAGMALVGAFRQASQTFRKGGIRVEASNSHADFFIRNLVAIRAEERFALAVYREAAFGKVDLAAP